MFECICICVWCCFSVVMWSCLHYFCQFFGELCDMKKRKNRTNILLETEIINILQK